MRVGVVRISKLGSWDRLDASYYLGVAEDDEVKKAEQNLRSAAARLRRAYAAQRQAHTRYEVFKRDGIVTEL